MALKPRAVTVTTAATRLDYAEGGENHATSWAGYNNGSVTVYVGDEGVTTANGFPVPPGNYVGFDDLDTTETVYGITASSSAEMRVVETGI